MQLISVLGDSISTLEGAIPAGWRVYYDRERAADTGVRAPEDTWWAQVIEHLGGAFLSNASYSGSLVEGAGFPAADSAERVAALGGLRGEAPDLVLVYLGINDYGWGGAAQQARGRGSALPECLSDEQLGPAGPVGDAPEDAAARFGAAYRSLLARLAAAFPVAEIDAITLCSARVRGTASATFTDSIRGIPLSAYNDEIRRAARLVPQVRLVDAAALGLDYEAREDGLHPTARGMRQLAALVVQAREAALRGEGEGTAGLARRRERVAVRTGALPADPCTRGRSCVGCPQAVLVAEEWWCACTRGGGSRQ